MSTWPAAVLFDFDGVIVDSEPLHLRAFQRVLGAEGMELTPDEYYRELIGFDDRGAFAHVYARRGRPLDPATAHRVGRAKYDVVQSLIDAGAYEPLAGAAALVRGLARHYPLAICSGALRDEIERMLDGVKLREHFAVIVSAEDVAVGKPDPSGYLLAARLLGEHAGVRLTPGDCLVVEDAPVVIRSVRAAGFSALGVATSYPLEALGGANYAVTTLEPAEVVRHIPQLRVA